MELIWWAISPFSEFSGKRLESAQMIVDQVTYRVCKQGYTLWQFGGGAHLVKRMLGCHQSRYLVRLYTMGAEGVTSVVPV